MGRTRTVPDWPGLCPLLTRPPLPQPEVPAGCQRHSCCAHPRPLSQLQLPKISFPEPELHAGCQHPEPGQLCEPGGCPHLHLPARDRGGRYRPRTRGHLRTEGTGLGFGVTLGLGTPTWDSGSPQNWGAPVWDQGHLGTGLALARTRGTVFCPAEGPRGHCRGPGSGHSSAQGQQRGEESSCPHPCPELMLGPCSPGPGCARAAPNPPGPCSPQDPPATRRIHIPALTLPRTGCVGQTSLCPACFLCPAVPAPPPRCCVLVGARTGSCEGLGQAGSGQVQASCWPPHTISVVSGAACGTVVTRTPGRSPAAAVARLYGLCCSFEAGPRPRTLAGPVPEAGTVMAVLRVADERGGGERALGVGV